ncbi:MAG: hypothetical protein OMM_05600 [Candidatus Magnetoglobus multicellularis str. Araruama]|uniref:VCBS repeat-containing protein n=1 Tax=Candidatus Magnetoglobus multicellularis str. Araruama TaxID=890399 RepID=A0A1V1NVG4_9BACT|nr:MAG: hypothetical protein OMM_05600 [Candidatus Magnetoglobus multicellularis str. Araruama]
MVTNAGEFVVAVYGDDTTTPEDEGASLNEDLVFVVWDASEAVEITLTNAMFIQKDAFGKPQIDTIPPKYLGNNEIRGMGISIANNSPKISLIENQHTIIDHPISIPFQLTDIEGGQLAISVSSSHTSLILPENISFTGTNITSDGSNYTIQAALMPEDITMIIQPVSGQSGDAMLTLTIDDNGTIVEKAFAYSVLTPFTEDENIVLPGVEKGSVAFGDYDNDGDLDILILDGQ